MLPVNLGHLYYFYAIARAGSFTQASRELMVSQSTLSIQVKHLEEALGVVLFNRGKGGVELTEMGQLVYQSAERIFQEVDRLQAALEEAEEQVKGEVAVGTVNSIGVYLLPDLLKDFKETYPQVRVTIDFKHAREVMALVHSGRVDLAIITWNRRYPELAAVPLVKLKMFLVAPPDHPLAGKSSLNPHDLEGYPFIAYEDGTPTRTMMDTLFKRMGLDVEYAMESSNAATIKHMAMAGLGLAFLPEAAVGLEIRQGVLVRLSVPSLAMAQEITLYYRKNRVLSPTKRAFVDFLREELARPHRSRGDAGRR